MANSQKRLLLNLMLGFGIFLGAILALLGLIPSRDLNNYTRLTDGAGQTVHAVSEGGAGAAFSGRRGSSSMKYCTSWRYELDGNERHFTDRKDCHASQEDAKSGTTAELIYDPSDLGTVFVHSDETLDKLKGGQTIMRILSIIGIVLLAGSIAGLVVTKWSKKQPEPSAEV